MAEEQVVSDGQSFIHHHGFLIPKDISGSLTLNFDPSEQSVLLCELLCVQRHKEPLDGVFTQVSHRINILNCRWKIVFIRGSFSVPHTLWDTVKGFITSHLNSSYLNTCKKKILPKHTDRETRGPRFTRVIIEQIINHYRIIFILQFSNMIQIHDRFR